VFTRVNDGVGLQPQRSVIALLSECLFASIRSPRKVKPRAKWSFFTDLTATVTDDAFTAYCLVRTNTTLAKSPVVSPEFVLFLPHPTAKVTESLAFSSTCFE
jgi:hypothetical protein